MKGVSPFSPLVPLPPWGGGRGCRHFVPGKNGPTTGGACWQTDLQQERRRHHEFASVYIEEKRALMMMQPKQELYGPQRRHEPERTPPPEGDSDTRKEPPRDARPEDVGCEFSVLLHLGLM